jgi:hypothetical protein
MVVEMVELASQLGGLAMSERAKVMDQLNSIGRRRDI